MLSSAMSPEYSWPTTPTNASWKTYNRIITSMCAMSWNKYAQEPVKAFFIR